MITNLINNRQSTTTQFPIVLSQNTNPVYQGIEGNGRFMAAKLTIVATSPDNLEHLCFSLKMDHNIIFYGMLAWYNRKGTLNPFGVEVSVSDHFEETPGKSLISITMELPYPMQYHGSIHAAVTSDDPSDNLIESACLNITAFHQENRPELMN